jgi:dynein heavy chain
LDTKRKAFPRFYFLTDDDLLEMLAMARNPITLKEDIRKLYETV